MEEEEVEEAEGGEMEDKLEKNGGEEEGGGEEGEDEEGGCLCTSLSYSISLYECLCLSVSLFLSLSLSAILKGLSSVSSMLFEFSSSILMETKTFAMSVTLNEKIEDTHKGNGTYVRTVLSNRKKHQISEMNMYLTIYCIVSQSNSMVT